MSCSVFGRIWTAWNPAILKIASSDYLAMTKWSGTYEIFSWH
jgi:hypothetical protein